MSSNRYFKVPIHVRPWVKKYIVANHGDTLLVSMKDSTSMVLYAFLQKRDPPVNLNPEVLHRRLAELSDSFHLLIQRRDQYKHGLRIHPENHLLINNFLENEIMKRIFHQCAGYTKAGLSRVEAIEDFCDQYGIEIDIDISLEATLKAEYRDRQDKKNLKKDSAVLSCLANPHL